jgi:hypothetical protein
LSGASLFFTENWRQALRGKFRVLFSVAFAVFIFSAPLAAHHGFANYDTDKKITVKGTVMQWIWSNPHCILQLDATDDSGQVVHWVAETENPSSMIRSGWTKDSLKAGEQITLTLMPVKDGRPVGRILEIVLPDGHKLMGRGSPQGQPSPAESAKP